MVRSNFTTVRLSDDGATLSVTGVSRDVDEIRELRIAVAAPQEADPLNVGADLAPLDEQILEAVAGPIDNPWTVDVAIEPGMFARGDVVALAGGAVCWKPQTTDGAPDGGRLRFETWIGHTTVLSVSDAKPV
ncbi:MAG: hypothetical protein Q8K79_15465 [Solirubrobacteraceae bacterium]|nr:hypothetical protein [Solirubrobacteraceae bacterium]